MISSSLITPAHDFKAMWAVNLPVRTNRVHGRVPARYFFVCPLWMCGSSSYPLALSHKKTRTETHNNIKPTKFSHLQIPDSPNPLSSKSNLKRHQIIMPEMTNCYLNKLLRNHKATLACHLTSQVDELAKRCMSGPHTDRVVAVRRCAVAKLTRWVLFLQ